MTRLKDPNHGVLAHYKSPTTTEVSKGIENAIREVLTSAAVASSEVTSVSIGTTAFVNAVLEADARRLAKVAVIRLCGPYTRQCPPFIDFPKRLRALTQGHVGYVDGGFESRFLETLLFLRLVHVATLQLTARKFFLSMNSRLLSSASPSRGKV